jgi:hypothetical protein
MSALALGNAAALPGTPAEASVLFRAAAADTIRLEVRAGLPLVTALPPRHQGRPASYRLLQAPALSWLVDRSFFWRTLPTESGTMPVLVRRVAPGVEPDTLVLMVRVSPG